MLPENYNTTVVKPVPAQSANQIGPERGRESGREGGKKRSRKDKGGGEKAKLVYTEKKNTAEGAAERNHALHASRTSGGGGRGGGGASQFSQQRRARVCVQGGEAAAAAAVTTWRG